MPIFYLIIFFLIECNLRIMCEAYFLPLPILSQ